MKSWKGFVAHGFPQQAMSFFAAASTPEEFMSLAWLLEEGTRKLYEGIAENLGGGEAVTLLLDLVSAEEHYKNMLKTLYDRRSR
jgi:hypothetical protein